MRFTEAAVVAAIQPWMQAAELSREEWRIGSCRNGNNRATFRFAGSQVAAAAKHARAKAALRDGSAWRTFEVKPPEGPAATLYVGPHKCQRQIAQETQVKFLHAALQRALPTQ